MAWLLCCNKLFVQKLSERPPDVAHVASNKRPETSPHAAYMRLVQKGALEQEGKKKKDRASFAPLEAEEELKDSDAGAVGLR